MARRGCAPRDAAFSGAFALGRGASELCLGPVDVLHARRSRAVTKTIFDVCAPRGLPDPAGRFLRALRVACGAQRGLRSVPGASDKVLSFCLVHCRSEATGNMCSRCWKASTSAASDAAVNEKAEAAAAFASAKQAAGLGAEVAVKPPAAEAKPEAQAVARVEPAEASPAEASPTAASPAAGPSDERPAQKPGRCFSCNKRVGLTGFKCRCDRVFCSSHRYSHGLGCPGSCSSYASPVALLVLSCAARGSALLQASRSIQVWAKSGPVWSASLA